MNPTTREIPWDPVFPKVGEPGSSFTNPRESVLSPGQYFGRCYYCRAHMLGAKRLLTCDPCTLARRAAVERHETERAAENAYISREMRGFWASLDAEQREAALAYTGPENHGDPSGIRETFQTRIRSHSDAVFGSDPTDVAERRDRFAEEAIELFQAFDGTEEMAHALVSYVFSRRKGDKPQEIGGTMFTLFQLASYSGHDAMACGEAELERTHDPEVVARVRRKRANRHGRGALPGVDGDLVSRLERAVEEESDALMGEIELHGEVRAQLDTLLALFEPADDGDWDRLLSMFPESGYGKFWRGILIKARAEIRKAA